MLRPDARLSRSNARGPGPVHQAEAGFSRADRGVGSWGIAEPVGLVQAFDGVNCYSCGDFALWLGTYYAAERQCFEQFACSPYYSDCVLPCLHGLGNNNHARPLSIHLYGWKASQHMCTCVQACMVASLQVRVDSFMCGRAAWVAYAWCLPKCVYGMLCMCV
jgi:hypothetical protein